MISVRRICIGRSAECPEMQQREEFWDFIAQVLRDQREEFPGGDAL